MRYLTETSHPLLAPETIACLQRLPLKARSVVGGARPGAHRSHRRGLSVEFAEHREYSAGDDLRHVDWKLYGKTNKVFVKQYEEESQLACYLLVDVSESMAFRGPSAPMSKIEFARRAAAALAYLGIGQRDSMGLITFDAETVEVIRPESHTAHLRRLLNRLQIETSRRETRIARALHDAARRIPRRGLILLLSDLLDDLEAMHEGLRHLKHQGHDLAVLHIVDRAELTLPFEGPLCFRGMERAADLVADASQLRAAYVEEAERFLNRSAAACRAADCHYALMPTDQPVGGSVARFLAERRHRTC